MLTIDNSGLYSSTECYLPRPLTGTFISVHDNRASRGKVRLELDGPSASQRFPVSRGPT